MKTKEEIKEMIEVARALSLESIEIDGMKFTLGNQVQPKPAYVEELKPEEMVKPLSVLDEYTDEEVLYWASSYFDELQMKKEAQTKQKLEDDELRKAV